MKSKEIKFVIYCNRLGGGKFDAPLKLFNSVGFLILMWSMLSALAVAKNPDIIKPFSLAVVTVAALHFVITEGVIKHALTRFLPKRQRPYVAYPDKIRPVGKRFSDSSFPSSHMTTTVAMLFVIVSFYPSLLWAAILLGVLMAFSRLHNGMHYPSDILAGIVLGAGYGALALGFINILT